MANKSLKELVLKHNGEEFSINSGSDSVRYTEQNLTLSQQAQVKTNLNITDVSAGEGIRIIDGEISSVAGEYPLTYSPQTLSSANQLVARTNIGIPENYTYSSLLEKPTFNGVEISGDKTTEDYNIAVPISTSELINDTDFINSDVTVLDNFYNKTSIDNIIGDMSILKYKVVVALPTTDISTSTNYLLYLTEGIYEQNMYIDNVWVQLGTTAIDLTDYVQNSDLVTALSTKADSDDLITEVTNRSMMDITLQTAIDTKLPKDQYASQSVPGIAKMWTVDGELHISTE